MSDRIFGVFGILLAIGFAISALAIEESFLSDAVGPKAFPLIIAAILGLASAVIVLRPDAEPQWPALDPDHPERMSLQPEGSALSADFAARHQCAFWSSRG